MRFNAQTIAANNKEKYYLTQETPSLLSRIVRTARTSADCSVDEQNVIAGIAKTYGEKLVRVLESALPDTNIVVFPQEQVDTELSEAIAAELREDPDVKIVCLDRFLLCEEKDFPIERLELCRAKDADGNTQIIERPGSEPLQRQLATLKESLNGARALLVDDGVFTGTSMNTTLQLLNEYAIPVKKVLCFLRNPMAKNTNINSVTISACKEMSSLKDWLDMRDFLTFCGRTRTPTSGAPYALTQYYLAPSDDGKKASLDTLSPEDFRRVSSEILGLEQTLLAEVEERLLKTRLTVEDILRSGFAITKVPSLPLPALADEYGSYLRDIQAMLATQTS